MLAVDIVRENNELIFSSHKRLGLANNFPLFRATEGFRARLREAKDEVLLVHCRSAE